MFKQHLLTMFSKCCPENVLEMVNSNWFSYTSFKQVFEVFSIRYFKNILLKTFFKSLSLKVRIEWGHNFLATIPQFYT